MADFLHKAYAAWRMNRAMKQAIRSCEEFIRQGYAPETKAVMVALHAIAERDLANAERDLLGRAALTQEQKDG